MTPLPFLPFWSRNLIDSEFKSFYKFLATLKAIYDFDQGFHGSSKFLARTNSIIYQTKRIP